ncbi:hypothetical protein GCM10009550_08010 [Actinocorallia libanotica]|uniref:Uncharacterized protein n=2 Tax=Actinocorallia libanotica TaxID=46162 RepID=A0ABN1Q9A6_9ACTN
MAALSAATRHARGHPAPCSHARRTARKAGAHLTTCLLAPTTTSPSPDTPTTTAEVTITFPFRTLRWLPTLTIPATARAGPAPP